MGKIEARTQLESALISLVEAKWEVINPEKYNPVYERCVAAVECTLDALVALKAIETEVPLVDELGIPHE